MQPQVIAEEHWPWSPVLGAWRQLRHSYIDCISQVLTVAGPCVRLGVPGGEWNGYGLAVWSLWPVGHTGGQSELYNRLVTSASRKV